MKPDIEAAVDHILNGLTTDGAHHKQWDMEQALIALKGEKWVEEQRRVTEDGNVVSRDLADDRKEECYERWEKGIPA
jgi:hypothetical protein